MASIKDLSKVYDMKVRGHYETDDYVFFWSGPFSNWYRCAFVMPWQGIGYKFCNSEQAMMLIKALTFGDTESAKLVMATRDAKEQKAIGRAVKGFDQAKWNEVNLDATYEFLLRKFYQNPDLRDILDNTGDKIIVEASPYDVVWGIGMSIAQYPEILDQSNWRGENRLGVALMRVRDELRKSGRVIPELELEAALITEIVYEVDDAMVKQILELSKHYDHNGNRRTGVEED